MVCLAGTGTTLAQSCLTATAGGPWENAPLASTQSGTFTVTFDATPSASPINSVIALSLGAQTAYTGFATLARFNPSGDIDARNGGAYAAASTIPYSGGKTYHFRQVINVPAHTYSTFVTPPGGSELTVGSNFAFRTEQNTVTSLDWWGVFAGAGSDTVCNFAIATGTPNFTFSASPSSQSVTAGGSTTYPVSVGAQNGFAGTVSFGVSGQPSGAGVTFSPASVTGSGSSTLTIATTSADASGTYPLTITGTSGALSHSASVSLVINPIATPDFSLSANPTSATVAAGNNTSYSITVTPSNGFNSNVTLTTSGLPNGTTASYNTNPVSGGSGSSTLSIMTSSSTPSSTYMLSVTGAGGGQSHSINLQLTVTSGGTVTFNGNPVLTPKWSFGILWGSYHNQTQVLSDMNMLRSGHYGGDMYWVDSSWLSSSYTGTPARYICFAFDPGQFPDPATMIGTLRQNHFWFGVWEWPWMDQGCQFFSHGVSNHFFIDDTSGNVVNAGGWHGNTFTGAFDYTNPATVTWWRSLNQPLANMGLSFYKLDTGGGYPSAGVTDDGKNSQDEYKALYRKTAYDFGAIVNGGRGFVLTHTQSSSHADQTPGMWTGDTTASFSGMVSEMSKAASLNNTSHTPFYCGDTGGYNQTPTSELYIRWLEYTTFTPCQEYFGAKTTSTGARFPWMFSTQAQQIALQYSQLRYRLLPFRYSNAIQQYEVLPLQYTSHWIGSTQLVNGAGDSQILVQPVTTASATSASVTPPSGANWIDYWTGAVYSGGSAHTVPAPINHIPTLVRAGSIIPMGPVMEWVDQVAADPLTLDIYPAGSTSYTLYEDDGVTTQYAAGAFSTTRFTSNNGSGHEVVTIGAANGSYTGQLSGRTYVLKINQQTSSPASVSRDGSTMTQLSSQSAFDAASEGWFFDATAHIVWVKFTISTSTATSVALN